MPEWARRGTEGGVISVVSVLQPWTWTVPSGGMWSRLQPARRPHPVGDAGPSQTRRGLRTLRDRERRVLEGSWSPAFNSGNWSQRAGITSWPQPEKEG